MSSLQSIALFEKNIFKLSTLELLVFGFCPPRPDPPSADIFQEPALIIFRIYEKSQVLVDR